MMIKNAWKYLWDAMHYIFNEGSWSLDKMHADIIQKVIDSLDRENGIIVSNQLEKKYFYCWMSGGRINMIFFYNEDDIRLLPLSEFSDRLFKVELHVEGRKHRAQVVFTKGRIHRVELSKPRSFFEGKAYRVGTVTEGQSKDSFTQAIDRADHGKGTGINP